MSQPPQPVPLMWEMVVATVLGVTVGIWTNNLLLGCGVGIGLGVVLSIIKTLLVERKKRKR